MNDWFDHLMQILVELIKVAGIIGTGYLAYLSAVATKRIDNAVNNRHHADEDGAKLGLFDVVIATHDEIKITKRITLENQAQLDVVRERLDNHLKGHNGPKDGE